ncbi:MAPEG family protein [Caulobacter sp. ErkDOM-YI]|uniref:MAPEG family protein n=1 Tax=unclassified Caulobacter TaxID=2648921 RepID=UPI003AF84606
MRVAIELQLLAVAVLIGLVHLLWASAAAQPQRGLKWNVGPRDTPVTLTGMAGRLGRASANFRETFPLFAAGVLAVYLSGRIGFVSAHGALLYVVARAIYLPLYAFGVPVARSLVWVASMIGLGMVLAAMVV